MSKVSQEFLEHYHGDAVRTLFVLSGIIMIVSYPFFRPFINEPFSFSVVGAIALAVFGGFMNPEQKWIIFLNTIIPVVGFLFFEHYAVYAYLNLSPVESVHVAFFWVNQILALTFFFAAYLSTRSLRAAWLASKQD